MSELTDHEKSVLLVEMQGWSIEHHEDVDTQTGKEYWTSWVSDSTGTPIEWPCGESTIEWTTPAFKPGWREFKLDLYLPVNMSLAWRCHLWAYHSAELNSNYRYRNWCVRDSGIFFLEDAQRLWLDKIVELIEVSDARTLALIDDRDMEEKE